MMTVDRVPARIRQALVELEQFDWAQLRHPESVGRWPMEPRLLVLAVCALVLVSLAFVLSMLLAPAISDDDYLVVKNLQEKTVIQRNLNSLVAARQLAQRRQNFFVSALSQSDSPVSADTAQAIELVRMSAVASGVSLTSVVQESLNNNNQAVFLVKARVSLSSLSVFWAALSNSPVYFSLKAVTLDWAEYPDLYALSLKLEVDLAAAPGQWVITPDKKPVHAEVTSAARKNQPRQKGFLMRPGDSRFFYVMGDEQGRLTSVNPQTRENRRKKCPPTDAGACY